LISLKDSSFKFRSYILPISELQNASSALGNVWAEPDVDGTFRHYRPIGSFKGSVVQGLPVALFNSIHPDINLGDWLKPFLDQEKRLSVKYYGGNGTIPTVPVANVLSSMIAIEEGREPLINLDFFRDSYVLVGYTAPGLYDLKPTTMDKRYRGVEFNATILANLLERNFVKKASFPTNFCLIVVFIFFTALSILYEADALKQLLACLVVIFFFFITHFVFAYGNVWTLQVVPFAGIVLTVILTLAYQFTTEGRRRRFIKNAFSHYLENAVVDIILADPESLKLGGEKKETTILFSDIKGFTTLSESLNPTILVQFLNEYLTAITSVILATNGTLDKYLGDAVMAFWNAPISIPDHAEKAVEAALQCQLALEILNLDFQGRYGFSIETRIGINTGEVAVGNFGSEKRFDYTVIGDAANLASRLEGLNKVFNTNILVSETTKNKCNSSKTFREVGLVQVVGKTKGIAVFEPLLDSAGIEEFNLAYQLFKEGKLLSSYEKFKLLKNDKVAAAYCKRIEEEGLSDVAGPNWSPIWVLTSK